MLGMVRFGKSNRGKQPVNGLPDRRSVCRRASCPHSGGRGPSAGAEQVEFGQVGQLTPCGGQGAGQLIGTQMQLLQLSELGPCGGQGAGQVVDTQDETLQVGQLTPCGGREPVRWLKYRSSSVRFASCPHAGGREPVNPL